MHCSVAWNFAKSSSNLELSLKGVGREMVKH